MEGDKRIFWRAGRLALLAGAAVMLTACQAIAELEPGANAEIDPNSPAAAIVAKAARDPGPWPTFADIPEIPEDVRTSQAWRDAVQDQEAEGLYTARTAAPDTWSLTATEAFVADQKAKVAEVNVHAPTAAEIAESEAYARSLRARATPPPPPR
ncbi:MAG: hypothetical protein KA744_00530 [Phenylobacterium sp.]|jgi:hypothetical protein|nr:hypothetical protein [Phenylobacterium sp.]